MSGWSLPNLFDSLDRDVQNRLAIARRSLGHSGTKGVASENVWLELFRSYLPKRYQAESAHVVDSMGKFSDQIDIVIFDRQYSPFIFSFEGQIIVPAESVYAVFESKQVVNASIIRYSRKKVASVRNLRRTSLPIPYAQGTYKPKPPIHILGGVVAFQSDWRPGFGKPFLEVLEPEHQSERLDLGCVAASGLFQFDKKSGEYILDENDKAATNFLFTLISMLQFSGTVPMIDIMAYARWLFEDDSTNEKR